ncbi:MAG: putative oxidoreductase [Acidimicrobiales bacterium]|nr:putative oxidoreductase [Acidimicrobiales bacterium]
MKALLYRETGGPDVLEYVDVADPQPGPRDVVVHVAAAALNHLDVVQRNGWFLMDGFTLPHIAGMDVAGTIVAVGSDVTHVRIGERVVIDPSLAEVPEGSTLAGRGDLYGALGVIGANADGGYAELCLAPETHVHVIPEHITDHVAASFPSAWLTAHHALFDRGNLSAGETVMIHAAGSGVSTAAIQLAKAHGATVLATAGTAEKCEAALALGADFASTNRDVDITGWAREVTDGAGVDMVFDHVGPALFAPSLFALKPRGRLVNCGNTSGDTAMIGSLGHLFHMGISIIGSDPYRYSEFGAVWREFTSGNFHTPIDSVFALADGAAAQDKMLRGDFFGKILLEP